MARSGHPTSGELRNGTYADARRSEKDRLCRFESFNSRLGLAAFQILKDQFTDRPGKAAGAKRWREKLAAAEPEDVRHHPRDDLAAFVESDGLVKAAAAGFIGGEQILEIVARLDARERRCRS